MISILLGKGRAMMVVVARQSRRGRAAGERILFGSQCRGTE